MGDCCLTPNQNFSTISWREQVNYQRDDDEIRLVLDQHADMDVHSASSPKQQSADRYVASLGPWFDPTAARTHDLPHSRGARYSLRHRCGYNEDTIIDSKANNIENMRKFHSYKQT